MAKRIASSELTDRNWDQEDEPEEAGIFTQAPKDILKQRQIKKAKRRNPNESSTGGVFSGFSGFSGLGTKSADTKSPVGCKFSAIPPLVQNGVSSFSMSKPASDNSSKTDNKSCNGNPKTDSSYYSSLKYLNKSLLSWIQTHIERDPFCILTPIFDDYQKHLDEIKKDSNNKENKEEDKNEEDSDPEVTINPRARKEESPKKDSAFSGFSATGSTLFGGSTFGGFNLPKSSTATTASSFGSSAFSFAVSKATTNISSAPESKDEEEYEPPKPETQEINEEGSIYTKRCKLFYQKDGNWKERGVGNLHIKVLDDGKAQIIVRADTSLGNILLNIMLTAAIPTKRQGKNNIFIVCVPNPPINPKDDSNTPVPMLIRVKTTEDADEMLEKMEEVKK